MADIQRLLSKLNLSIPMEVTVPNPFHPDDLITVTRENLAGLLVFDADDPTIDRQTVAALMGEMAMLKAGCKIGQDRKGIEYRRWKADRVNEVQADFELVGVESIGKITDKLREAYWRDHEDYAAVSEAPDYYKNLASFFGDIFESLREKSAQLKSGNYQERSFSSARGAERDDDVSAVDVDGDDELGVRLQAQSGKELEDYLSARRPGGPDLSLLDKAPLEEEEDDSEDTQDEEDHEETDPPPPPLKRSAKAKKTAKAKAKKTTKKTSKKRRPRSA